jgi:AcrR family transcriptional regulator
MNEATLHRKARRGRPPAENGTRERILDAAIEHFSRTSYEATGLRDIAATAGVDAAYVHRSFGDKKRLFAEAVSAAVKPQELIAGAIDELPELIAKDLLAHRGSRLKGLDIIVRSLTSKEAGPMLREFISREFVEPLAQRLEGSTTQAAVIAAEIVGVAILRNVIALTPLCEPEGGKLEGLLSHVLRETAKGRNSSK